MSPLVLWLIIIAFAAIFTVLAVALAGKMPLEGDDPQQERFTSSR